MHVVKILCMCQGGNSRSVGAAFLFKYGFGIDALACSWEKNSPATIEMLCKWANHVCILERNMMEYVPSEFQAKVWVLDVGPDVWLNGLDRRLHAILLPMITKKMESIGWKEMIFSPSSPWMAAGY